MFMEKLGKQNSVFVPSAVQYTIMNLKETIVRGLGPYNAPINVFPSWTYMGL